MRYLIFIVFILLMPLESGAETVLSKAKNPTSWIGRKATKYGFIIAVCSTNTLRMAKEADNFDSRELLGENTYHTINALEIAGLILSGYMLYAVLDRDDWTWKDKVQLISGTLSLSREFGEFTYQGMRHSDPFNNNPAYHQNEIAWFTSKPTFPWVQDRMISTGRVSTPALHFALTGIGMNLIGGVK